MNIKSYEVAEALTSRAHFACFRFQRTQSNGRQVNRRRSVRVISTVQRPKIFFLIMFVSISKSLQGPASTLESTFKRRMALKRAKVSLLSINMEFGVVSHSVNLKIVNAKGTLRSAVYKARLTSRAAIWRKSVLAICIKICFITDR